MEKSKAVKGIKSLKAKMLLYFLAAMAAIFIAVGVIIISEVSNVVVTLNNDMTEQVVLARADEIGKYIDDIINEVTSWSQRNTMMSGDVNTIKSDLEERQSSLRSDFETVLYAKLDGDYYASTGDTGSIADRDYFKEIVSGGENYAVSNPVVSKITGEPVFVVAHAVRDDAGNLSGVFAATILMDTFNNVIDAIKIGEAGYPWISDNDGLVIAHPEENVRLTLNTMDSAKEGFDGLDEVGKKMMAGEAGLEAYVNAAGEKYYAVFAPIPDTPDWSMAYSISETEMMAPVNNLTLIILIIMAISLAVVAAVTFLISSRIVKPVRESAALAKALASGDLGKTVTVKTADEVGQLTEILDKEVRGAFRDIEEARVLADKQAAYQSAEVDKLLVNLQRLARGELYCDIVVADADADTEAQHTLFSDIADNLGGAVKEIKSYIGEISQVLGEMSRGNLDVGIAAEYRGEFIALKDSINNIVVSLNSVLGEIGVAADQVASGTQQVSEGSQEISQGATEQSSAIEELTASVTQIAAQTKQNAMSANKANELTEAAASEAVRGNERMKAMQQAMTEINEASENISKIIKVIDDIAFQTNILALNAAVEAARAGVHGKGFAVVAEEVRNLAARSAGAAKETTELIEGSISKTDAGTKIADETAAALTSIVDGVDKAAQLVGEIARASSEQATAITQVNRGIEQMSQVVQTNSATSEEAAAAAEELSSQAELLKNMVGQFNLKESAVPAGAGAAGKPKHARPKPALNAPKIDLSDNDFGKY